MDMNKNMDMDLYMNIHINITMKTSAASLQDIDNDQLLLHCFTI
jgi:hypothetical protein